MSEKESVKHPDDVNPGWIKSKMEENAWSQTQVSDLTGIPKSNISSWLSGKRPLSQIAKAMFYFMLK